MSDALHHKLKSQSRAAHAYRAYTYAMRDPSGASVDVTRVSKSGSGKTAAEWAANGEATHNATARCVATDKIPQ